MAGNADANNPLVAPELEAAVLGALILEPEQYGRVASRLQDVGLMSRVQHRVVLVAINKLAAAGEPIDLLTVTTKLREMQPIGQSTAESGLKQAGGAVYISELTSCMGSAAHVEYHVLLLHQYAMLRRLRHVGADLQAATQGENVDPFDVAAQGIEMINKLMEGATGSAMIGLRDAAQQAYEQLVDVWQHGKPLGISTGWRALDIAITGLHPANTYVVGARAKRGKSAFAMALARSAAQQGKHVAYFSLEMEATELAVRNFAIETDIFGAKLFAGKATEAELKRIETEALPKLDLPIHLWAEHEDLTPDRLLGICLQRKARGELDLVVIDYLQLMSAGKRFYSRQEEVQHLSRQIKRISQRLQVPIVVLSQLNREAEGRDVNESVEPTIRHLRESGAMENDASAIILLWDADAMEWSESKANPVKHPWVRLGWKVPVARNAPGYQPDPGNPDPSKDLMIRLATGAVREHDEALAAAEDERKAASWNTLSTDADESFPSGDVPF